MAQCKHHAPEPQKATETIAQLRDRIHYLHTLLSDTEEALGVALAERYALKAALARAYEAGRDDAAKEAGHHLSTPDDVILANDIIDRIHALTPPADLEERVGVSHE